MDVQKEDVKTRLLPERPRPPRFGRVRSWLRSRPGRVIFPSATFLLGIIVGVAGILLYAFSIASEGQMLVTPVPPNGGDIVIQVGPAYITHLVAQDLQNSGMPGQVENVRVSLNRSDQMTITGDDRFSVLGVGVTRQFTVLVQPFVRACLFQVHVLHADTQGIPVTGFVANFEGQINQQLQVKPTNLPKGFVYCAVAARTDPKGLFVTYSATPVNQSS